jgi:transcriptional regulator GlxA family with amidase domain
LFRRHLGISPAAFASATRLDRARALLRQTAMPVTDVGIACGFTSASHFSTAYRGRFGHAPRTERLAGNATEQRRDASAMRTASAKREDHHV